MSRDFLSGFPRSPQSIGLSARSIQGSSPSGDSVIASLNLALGAGGDPGYTTPGFYAFQVQAGKAINFKLWGAGGSAGSLFASGSSGGAGGDGGFCSGTYVTQSAGLLVIGIGLAPNARPGQVITNLGLASWLLVGAPGGYSYFVGNEGGQGGGATVLAFNGSLIAVSGGGGGGGAGDRNGTTSGACGGQGGGNTAGNGNVDGQGGGAGGAQSPRMASAGQKSASPQTGDAPGSAGGGGGGGYGGGYGGSGRDYTGAYGNGGGGGSGYLNPVVTSGQNLTSRNSADPDYGGNAGKGGTAIYPNYVNAISGRAVLRW